LGKLVAKTRDNSKLFHQIYILVVNNLLCTYILRINLPRFFHIFHFSTHTIWFACIYIILYYIVLLIHITYIRHTITYITFFVTLGNLNFFWHTRYFHPLSNSKNEFLQLRFIQSRLYAYLKKCAWNFEGGWNPLLPCKYAFDRRCGASWNRDIFCSRLRNTHDNKDAYNYEIKYTRRSRTQLIIDEVI